MDMLPFIRSLPNLSLLWEQQLKKVQGSLEQLATTTASMPLGFLCHSSTNCILFTNYKTL